MSDLAAEIEAQALEAQKFTRKHLVVELDYSERSIEELENQFDTVEYAIKGGKSAENVEMLTRIWGSYLGEALRRHGGGQWRRETTDQQNRTCLQRATKSLYPHEQVRLRLTAGSEHNVWRYFLRER
jgi:ribosomal protein S6E (S10)